MKGWLIGLGIVAAIPAGIWWWLYSYDVLYDRSLDCRLTLSIDTPEGERSGSGVVTYQAHFADGFTRWLGSFVGYTVYGQAVVIDLKPRGLLFVLLDRDSSKYDVMIHSLFPMRRFPGAWPPGQAAVAESDKARQIADYFDALNRWKPQADVPFADLPTIVRFGDLDDPTSVQRVDPNDLAATLGAGVTLKRATLAITGDAPRDDPAVGDKLPRRPDPVREPQAYHVKSHIDNRRSIGAVR